MEDRKRSDALSKMMVRTQPPQVLEEKQRKQFTQSSEEWQYGATPIIKQNQQLSRA